MLSLNLFILGGIAMACLVVGLYFLKFWFKSQDRLFLWFSLSFLLESVNRTALALSDNPREGEPAFYLVRLVGFGLILYAVFDKNRHG